jgi:NADH dehydrogenase
MKNQKKKLVIVGGGFAGVSIAKELLKSPYARKNFEITLVDKKDYHLFYPALFKAVLAAVEPSQIFSVLAVKFKEIFQAKEINFLKKEVVGISPEKNRILLKMMGKRHQYLDYDYLVIAAGSQAKLRSSSHLTLNSFEDVLRIKSKIEGVLKTKAKRKKISIAVIGAGTTGCGLIAALFEYVHQLADVYGHPHGSIQFKLIESGNHILFGLSSWLRSKTENRLKKMGVEILLNKDGDSASADVIIWASGLKPVSFGNSNLEPTPTLRLNRHKNIFIIKNVISAQSAMHQAKYIARALKKSIKRKRTQPYRPNKNIFVIELGNKYAFADLGVIKLKGAFAKQLHYLAFLKYFMRILSFGKALEWLRRYKSL